MPKIAVVEDVGRDADTLRAYIERFSEDRGVRTSVRVFSNAVDFLDKYSSDFDIVFMDIEMPMLSGMDASRKLRAMDGEVVLIFVTNLAQYAVEGYEVNAFDFIVKPVNYHSFSMKFERALDRLGRSSGVIVRIKTREKLTCVPSSEIKYIEVYDHDLVYHTVKGDMTATGTLSDVESKLEGAGFFRLSRYSLVNLSFVRAVRSTHVDVGGAEVQISGARRKELMAALAGWLDGRGGGR